MPRWFFATIISLLVLSSAIPIRPSEGQVGTFVARDIVEDTVWVPEKSPYIIARSVVISAKLELRPGAEVRIVDDATLRISSAGGRLAMLLANGTQGSPITIKGQGERHNWGIVVNFGRLHLRHAMFPESVRLGVTPGTLYMQNSKVEGDLLFSSINGDVDLRSVTAKSIRISDPQFWSIFVGTSVRFSSVTSESIVIDTIGPRTTTELVSVSTGSLRLGAIAGNLGRPEYAPAKVLVRNSTIAFGSGVSIDEAGGTVNITHSSIYSNTPHGLEVGVGRVSAENNWWGDASGPNHTSVNPGGKGDRIRARPDDVNLVPWLKTQPVGAPQPIQVKKEAPKEVVKEAPKEKVKEVAKEVPKEVVKEVIRTVTVETIGPITYLAIGVAVVSIVIAVVFWVRMRKAEDRVLSDLRSR